MKFQTRYNPVKSEGEVNDMPSMTVPGQVITLPEMISRLRAGMEVQANNQEWPEDDEEVPFPKIKDLTDLDDLKSQLKNTQQKINKQKEEKVIEKGISLDPETLTK